MTTLEWSETGFESPANEAAVDLRAGVPEILEFNVNRARARQRVAIMRQPGEAVVIDARALFRRR